MLSWPAGRCLHYCRSWNKPLVVLCNFFNLSCFLFSPSLGCFLFCFVFCSPCSHTHSIAIAKDSHELFWFEHPLESWTVASIFYLFLSPVFLFLYIFFLLLTKSTLQKYRIKHQTASFCLYTSLYLDIAMGWSSSSSSARPVSGAHLMNTREYNTRSTTTTTTTSNLLFSFLWGEEPTYRS